MKGEGDFYSLHAGCPPNAGEKWAANKWCVIFFLLVFRFLFVFFCLVLLGFTIRRR
jgi:hypothetical protein